MLFLIIIVVPIFCKNLHFLHKNLNLCRNSATNEASDLDVPGSSPANVRRDVDLAGQGDWPAVLTSHQVKPGERIG